MTTPSSAKTNIAAARQRLDAALKAEGDARQRRNNSMMSWNKLDWATEDRLLRDAALEVTEAQTDYNQMLTLSRQQN